MIGNDGWHILVVAGILGMEDHAMVGEEGSGGRHGMSLRGGIPQAVNINDHHTWSMHGWMDKTGLAVIGVHAGN